MILPHPHRPSESSGKTSGVEEELRSVVAVFRHADRSPKQKMKLVIQEKHFLELFNIFGKDKTNDNKKEKEKEKKKEKDDRSDKDVIEIKDKDKGDANVEDEKDIEKALSKEKEDKKDKKDKNKKKLNEIKLFQYLFHLQH